MFQNSLEQNQNSKKEDSLEDIYILLIESSTIVKNIQQEQNEILKEPSYNTLMGSKLGLHGPFQVKLGRRSAGDYRHYGPILADK